MRKVTALQFGNVSENGEYTRGAFAHILLVTEVSSVSFSVSSPFDFVRVEVRTEVLTPEQQLAFQWPILEAATFMINKEWNDNPL